MTPLLIDGENLTIENVHEVAFERRQVSVHPAAIEKIQKSRHVVESIVNDGQTVYGISTGFGKLSDVRIGKDEIAQLQKNLVRSHACGIGDPLSLEETRALILMRANVLAKGFSGVRSVVVERLCDLLNHNVYPVIPCRGSVGASGDLAPLAHLALVLMGEGEVFGLSGRMSGRETLEAMDLPPLELQAKEGLALTNGTQATLATGVICLRRAQQLMDLADLGGAMTLEALRGTPVAFDPRIHEARPHKGQRAIAKRLMHFLRNSEIRQSHLDCARVQDAYSIRCIPQVHGPVRDCLDYVRGVVEIELNS